MSKDVREAGVCLAVNAYRQPMVNGQTAVTLSPGTCGGSLADPS